MCRSDGELPTWPPATLAPSPCGKSKWQDLKGAEGNVKYDCSDAREWPAGRRSCGGEGGHRRLMSGQITSTHILLKDTDKVVCWIPFKNVNGQRGLYPSGGGDMGLIADRRLSRSSGPDRPRLNVAVVTCPTEKHALATILANKTAVGPGSSGDFDWTPT